MSQVNRFREAREFLGFDLQECARFLKVSKSELELLEAGKAVATVEFIGAASRLYGRPAGWLIGYPEKEQRKAPAALVDLVRGKRQVSAADAGYLADFALYLQHRAEVRGIT